MSAAVNGTPVPVTVTGSGQEVSAEGCFVVSQVGSYTVTASASDTVGNERHAPVDITVNYNVSWMPPLALGKTINGGATMPIKFSVRDCNGTFVNDPSVKVVVWQTDGETAILQLESAYGTSSTGVRIDTVDELYIVNFQTAAGANSYRADVYFTGVLDAQTTGWVKQASRVFSTTLPGKK